MNLYLLYLKLKSVGPNILIPFITMYIGDIIMYVLSRHDILTHSAVLLISDMLISLFSAWPVPFLFQPFFENECGSLFRSYPLNWKKWGLGNTFIFYIIYIALILINTVFLTRIIPNSFPVQWICLRQVLLSFFFYSLAYFAIVYSRNVNSCIVIMISYTFACQFLGDYLPSFINVFQNYQRYYSLENRTIASIPVSVFCGWILCIFAQCKFEEED